MHRTHSMRAQRNVHWDRYPGLLARLGGCGDAKPKLTRAPHAGLCPWFGPGGCDAAPPDHRLTQRTRCGFTLVELLVAIVLLNVGLLALVGGSAALVRRHSGIHLRADATQVATARLEQLATSPCQASSGELRHDGLNETWTTSALAHDVRELADSVAFSIAGANTAVTLRTRVRC